MTAKHEMNDDTNRHIKVDGETSMRPEIYIELQANKKC